MPYYRRAAKRPRYGKRDKYSIQQKAFNVNLTAATTQGAVIVPPVSVEGMRKVKHITVNVTSAGTAGQEGTVFWWAIVYLPQGTTLGNINIDGTAMYEPNQFVMNCGIADSTAGPIRFSSPISRNLNDGDSIVLAVRSQVAQVLNGVVRYAITLQ